MDENDAQAAEVVHVDVAVAEGPRFYSDTIPRPESFDPAIFERSVASAHRGEAPSEAARDSYTMYWEGNPHPWRHACRDGMPPVEDADVIAREEAAKAAAESDDASSVSSGAHGERLRGFGVRVAWLLAFTFAHNCWDWPTWRVQRDIIKPATAARGRRRYAELDEVAPHTGPATVFMSHCWGAAWGGLVMAACAGARHDRVVWIDVFAVRARAPRELREGGGRAAPAACDPHILLPPSARRCANGRATAPTSTSAA